MKKHIETCAHCDDKGYPEDFHYLGDGMYICAPCLADADWELRQFAYIPAVQISANH